LTVKGQRLISEADLVLYAGSLVPTQVVESAKAGARVADSAPMNLEETHAIMLETVRTGGTVARVHTGDPALYGAIQEQIDLLDRDGIEYAVIPGVTSASAAAAAACASFTAPEITQTMMLTRMAGRTPVPEGEELRKLAAHGSAMGIYLSAGNPEGVQRELLAGGAFTEETPLVVAYRVGWPEEKVVHTTVGELATTAHDNDFTRQTLFLVLPGHGSGTESKLYDRAFSHGYRKGED